ncbi:hypothetical protein KME66_20505 [Streptomyces sp. YPW6]|uniref:hypothetical protein n=1 Tax=Streptomyces sp. YPW6 TaxID=2840373 RepID=UPI001C0B259F|nr:hypothetical protein [Streptomyces sp. YPW6]QWQ43095.1 hypothetical protein KME66_20505 [Streptomyces sp. YPW6]
MTSTAIPRDQAIRNARAVLDRALDRIARDRAEGRLAPDAVARLQLAEARYARRHRQQEPAPRAA